MKIAIDKLFRIYAIVIGLNIIIFTFLYFFFPQLRKYFFSEDYLVENITAVFFLISFFLGIFLIIRIREKKLRRLYLILPLISILGFLEEISYGQRIFNYKVPKLYSERFDALHDLVTISYSFLMMHARYFLLYVIPIVICAAILLLYIKYRRQLPRISRLFESYPPFGFLFVALGLIFVSEINDLRFIKPDFRKLIEELFEMNAALTLFFAVLATGNHKTVNNEINQSVRIKLKKISTHFYKIFSILIILGVASFVIYSTTTAQLVEQNELYVTKNVLLIFSSWDSEKMINEMIPELVSSQTQRHKIKNSFHIMQKKVWAFRENYVSKNRTTADRNLQRTRIY